MTIRYTVTDDDFLNFNEYHMARSASVKRIMLALRLLVPALLSLAILALRPDPAAPSLIVFGLISVAWFFYLPRSMRKSIRKRVGKILQTQEGHGLTGNFELRLEDGGIRLINGNLEKEYPYASLQSVARDGDALYLYFGGRDAVQIPAAAFAGQEERQAFLDALERKTPVATA